MIDFSHLDALTDRLIREKARLANARTANEIAFREREIAACEKEIDTEYKFLGIERCTLSDDELLAELLGE